MRIVHLAIATAIAGIAAPAAAAPILPGNSTQFTVTWGATLAAAGITGGLLGTATGDSSGPFPVVFLPITGGFTNPDGTEQIDHNGSGVSLSAGGFTIGIENFVVDTSTNLVDVDVTNNGVPVASAIPAFDIVGPGLTLTLTPQSVAAINGSFNTTAFSTSTVAGTLVTNPIVGPAAVPKPATISLLGISVLGLYGLRRRAG